MDLFAARGFDEGELSAGRFPDVELDVDAEVFSEMEWDAVGGVEGVGVARWSGSFVRYCDPSEGVAWFWIGWIPTLRFGYSQMCERTHRTLTVNNQFRHVPSITQGGIIGFDFEGVERTRPVKRSICARYDVEDSVCHLHQGRVEVPLECATLLA